VTSPRDEDVVLDPAAGTGSALPALDHLVRLYLTSRGWHADPPGSAGALWRRGEDQVIAVPARIPVDSAAWRSVIDRIGVADARSPEDVASSIQLQMTDVTRLRAANDIVISGSIPLPAGVNLVSSAYAMLRAAATASVRPRAHIAGNFSKLADEVVAQARLGHTQSGSYIIPLLMPLTSPPDDRTDAPPVPGMEIERSPIEPSERRVTRTLAQALDAVDRLIVQPARKPRPSDLTSAVVAGVTRELVTLSGSSTPHSRGQAWLANLGVSGPRSAFHRMLWKCSIRWLVSSRVPCIRHTSSSQDLSLRFATSPMIPSARSACRQCGVADWLR
jgi:hypothetical protein